MANHQTFTLKQFTCNQLNIIILMQSLSVRAQLDNVTVLCTSTLECGNEIGEMTARQCCVENESGLAITLREYDVCLVCIGELKSFYRVSNH